MRAQTVVPADTPVEIRLTTRLSTAVSRTGDPVHAILAAPVFVGNKVVLPLGSEVEGRVVHVNRVRLGLRHETSSLGIAMERVMLADGTSIPLAARVAQVQNSREVVDKHSHIAGVRSTSTLSHKAAGAVGTLAFSNPIALVFATASSASLLRFSNPEIYLPADTELVLLTTTPISLKDETSELQTPVLAADHETEQALAGLVREQPFRTVTVPKHIPSDITNLMFVGEEAAIRRAFAAAGWLQVDSLNASSTYLTVRSLSEQQAYRTAPMSTLLLEGQRPAFALAKTLDTFSKRHHLRVFATHDRWQGERVWLSSSTQDIGIGFSASQKTFIHQIDHNIDHERTKVVNDLLLTGCVTGMNIVARPWMPTQQKNGTGEDILTDNRMAVLRISYCLTPAHVAPPGQTADVPFEENTLIKATRQTTLTLRNTLLRDNLVVTAYGGVKAALGLKHPKPPEQPLGRSSEMDTHRYTIGGDNTATLSQPELQKRDTSSFTSTEAGVTEPAVTKMQPPYTVELGVHSGFAGYAGGNGGAIGYLLLPDGTVTGPPYLLALGNEHHDGFNIGGSVTLNSHEHFSHEISFDYNRTGFTLGFADLDVTAGADTDPATAANFEFEEATLATTEVAYNLQYHFRRRESRWRPYVSVGPSLRLMHLTEAPITKASSWFKLGLSTVGAITAAYEFGSTPPLEGGGLFQVGLQYGGGIKYRASRRILVRADYKETLTAQPDFWSKSKDDIFDASDLPGYGLTVVGPIMDGPMRQQRATMGVSFIF